MATPNSLAGIEIFTSVVKAGSFTRAAAELGITKSAVAKSVSQLEARLGVRLLHRTTRKLTLTPEGSAFFAQTDTALEQLRHAEDAARSRATTLRGILRVDMPMAFGRRVALPIIFDILREHSELRLEASFSDRIIDPIEEGIDLCIRFGGLPDRTDVAARKIGEQRQIICASPGYLAKRGIPGTVEELADHSILVNSRSGRPRRWRLTYKDGSAFDYEPTPTHVCNDGEAIIAMTLAGFGLCQMPESLLAPFVREGTMVQVLDAATSSRTPLYLLWPIVRHMLPRVRVVVDEFARRADAGQLWAR